MAATKTLTVIHNNVTLTASAADTTSSAVNLTDGYGAVIDVKLTNGGTGPTVPAQTQIEVSEDGSNWYEFGGPLIGSTGNSAVVSYGGVEIPPSIQYVRTVSGSNTGQDVTLRVECSELSALS